MNFRPTKNLIAVTSLILLAGMTTKSSADDTTLKKDKLQIVFVMGQSNAVGLADIGTSWYLTQPQYIPPRDLIMKKEEFFNWSNFYWQGVRNYQGPAELEKQLEDLIDERSASRSKWRGRANAKGAWQPEWGEKPGKGRTAMYAFLDRKAKEEGIFDRMAKILDGPENQFPIEMAYQEIINRDQNNAEQLKRVREIYLNGTDGKDFDPFLKEINTVKTNKKSPEKPEDTRVRLAKLGEQTVKLPIAKRTRIFSHGAVASNEDKGIDSTAHGPLSIGWGGQVTTIGPEYGLGITLERLVDAPILLVKCAWGNTTVSTAWRPGSLDGVETPTEKAVREAFNAAETAKAKAAGREPKLRQPPEKTGSLAWCWSRALPAIQQVLKDPGAYHPDYDPAKGYDIAGMVWFQGYSDKNNEAYGEQLEEMIKWFRNQIKAPEMPVVCGSLGMGTYSNTAMTGNVNRGMVQVANSPTLKGSVDVVNTGRFYPMELDAAQSVFKYYEKDSPEYSQHRSFLHKTISNKTYHYLGSAKFFILAGDAMARSLANLMAGGPPEILDDAKAAE